MRHQLIVAGGLLALSLRPGVAAAQDQSGTDRPVGARERIGLSGSVRAGVWTSTRQLDAEPRAGAAMLWLKATRPVTDRVSFLFESRSVLSGPGARSETTTVREAFVTARLGRLDLRVGRQIIAWGRADGVNPTDNLTGEDLTLLVADDDDRRIGAAAIRASFYAGDVSFTGIWLPEFAPHRMPLPPIPGLTFQTTSDRWGKDSWAGRVEQTGRAVDWSVSYYSGPDLSPDLEIDPLAPASIRLVHRPTRVFGADLAATTGKFGVRAEIAFTAGDDPDGTDPFAKNSFLFLVAGADRTFREHLNLNVQYLHRTVLDFRPVDVGAPGLASRIAVEQAVLAGQIRRAQHGASVRAAYRWLRDTLEVECAAAGYFDPRGLTIRPKLTYAVSDHWKFVAGAEIFRGEALSMFERLRPNSAAFLEVRRSF